MRKLHISHSCTSFPIHFGINSTFFGVLLKSFQIPKSFPNIFQISPIKKFKKKVLKIQVILFLFEYKESAKLKKKKCAKNKSETTKIKKLIVKLLNYA